ncbi:MAG: hypothetical protein IJ225_06560 [Solobacterium sp.]|nr:hypothetical protein [Solobacterium sp.]
MADYILTCHDDCGNQLLCQMQSSLQEAEETAYRFNDRKSSDNGLYIFTIYLDDSSTVCEEFMLI